jgi:hemolysin III
MHWLIFREPVNAWTHGVWAVAALPGCLLLWRVCRGDRVKQWSLLLFGVTLALCFGGSALYHGVRLPASQIEICRMIDHIGIFLLIGGTVTPAALVLLDGRWQLATLVFVWSMAIFGIFSLLVWPTVPPWLYTLQYVLTGWGACLGYFEMARSLPARALRPVWLGGLLYTIGAMMNLAEWPVLVPGVFGSHELWHVFGMAGSFCHFWFMLRWVARFDRRQAVPAGAIAVPSSTPALAQVATAP